MTLSVSVPKEIELALRQRAAAVGKDVESYVREVLVEEMTEDLPYPLRSQSHVEFMSRLREIVERHGIRNGNFDDSRESIYAGRGE